MLASIPMGGEETPLVYVLVDPGIYNGIVKECKIEEFEGKNGIEYRIVAKLQITGNDGGQTDIPQKDKTVTHNVFVNRKEEVKKLWVCTGNPREITDFDPTQVEGKPIRFKINHRPYTKDGEQKIAENVTLLLDPEIEKAEKIRLGYLKA